MSCLGICASHSGWHASIVFGFLKMRWNGLRSCLSPRGHPWRYGEMQLCFILLLRFLKWNLGWFCNSGSHCDCPYWNPPGFKSPPLVFRPVFSPYIWLNEVLKKKIAWEGKAIRILLFAHAHHEDGADAFGWEPGKTKAACGLKFSQNCLSRLVVTA